MARRNKSSDTSASFVLLVIVGICLFPLTIGVLAIVGIIKAIAILISRSKSAPESSYEEFYEDEDEDTLSVPSGKYYDLNLEREYRIKYCPQCGRQLRDYWKSCSDCHYRFGDGELPIYTRPSITSYEYWLASMYKGKRQRERFLRSSDVSIKSHAPDYRWANVYSSDHSDVYTVTWSQCDCIDFQQRGVPCKHMYAVMKAAGLLTSISDFFDIPRALASQLEAFQNCNPSAASSFFSIVYSYSDKPSRIIVHRSAYPFKLIDSICEFALAEQDDLTADDLISYVDKHYTLREFKELCSLSCSEIEFPKLRKHDFIEYMLSQSIKLTDYFSKQIRAIVISEDILRLGKNIYEYSTNYLCNK